MIVTSANLQALFTSYNAAFKEGLTAPSQYEKISMTIPSSNAANIYPWLGNIPTMREWLGDRVVENLKTHDYTIKNKAFEVTVGVKREDIEDDNYGVYTPLFTDLGNQAVIHPNQLVFDQLKHGHTRECFDGQYFFDTDHPLGEPADNRTVSNSLAPSSDPGPAWYLLCTSRAIRPLIFQKRRDYILTRMDAPTDEHVFMRSEFRYGLDARVNVGYGLWQLAIRSTHPLTPDNYAAARTAMISFTNDKAVPLGLIPDLLVVPATLESAARRIVISAIAANGATNEWAGSAELLVSPWL